MSFNNAESRRGHATRAATTAPSGTATVTPATDTAVVTVIATGADTIGTPWGRRRARIERAEERRRRRWARRSDRMATPPAKPKAQASSFGLTAHELVAHARALRRQGWSAADVCARLVEPRQGGEL